MSRPELPDVPFTNGDLPRLRISRKVLRRMVREQLVRRVVAGVYVAAHVPDSIELRAQALSLVVGPNHVVRDRTAAWLHGVDAFSYGELGTIPPLETSALRGTQPCERQGVDSGVRDLSPRDVIKIGSVRVTTPLRTALDLGCHLHRRDALAALDRFRRRFGITQRQLVVESRRYRRRRGVVQLRELIPLSDPRAESTRESWTRLEIHDAQLPPPEPQFWIVVDGVRLYRLDLAYPHRRIAIEYDGFEFHRRTPEQKLRDEARRRWLRDHGWTVIEVRAGDFTAEGRERWIEELREALRPTYSNVRRLERGSRTSS